jgi:hypothetical protein
MGFAIVSEVGQPKRVAKRASLDCDIAMWIDGPVDVLWRIRDAALVLSAPLLAKPITGGPPWRECCYR